MHPRRTGPLVLTGATADVLATLEGAWDLLSRAERERALRFRFQRDRDSFVAAHALVRVCAAMLLGTAPESLTLEQECAACGGPHGKPRLFEAPEVEITLAHTSGHVAAIAGSGPVGVDVERVENERSWVSEVSSVLSHAENEAVQAATDPPRAFLRQWVRKEALIKAGVATLDGLAHVDLASLPIDEPDGDCRLSRWRDFYVVDWVEPGRSALGAAVARGRPDLQRVAPEQPWLAEYSLRGRRA